MDIVLYRLSLTQIIVELTEICDSVKTSTLSLVIRTSTKILDENLSIFSNSKNCCNFWMLYTS